MLKNFYGISAAQAALYLLALRDRQPPRTAAARSAFRHRRAPQDDLGTYTISRGRAGRSRRSSSKPTLLTATTHTIFWCVSFFFASAGASAGYLTVSEIFPLEVRGQAIWYFFAIAQCVGALGPVLYGALIGDGGSRAPMFWGYVLAAGVMLFGAFVAAVWGVDAEGKSLEEIAPPLTEYDDNGEQITHLPV